jgi:hypothetical protein
LLNKVEETNTVEDCLQFHGQGSVNLVIFFFFTTKKRRETKELSHDECLSHDLLAEPRVHTPCHVRFPKSGVNYSIQVASSTFILQQCRFFQEDCILFLDQLIHDGHDVMSANRMTVISLSYYYN